MLNEFRVSQTLIITSLWNLIALVLLLKRFERTLLRLQTRELGNLLLSKGFEKCTVLIVLVKYLGLFGRKDMFTICDVSSKAQ
jgi:hypothetical protein